MKIGTILRNESVSDNHPFRYSVYTGLSGKMAKFIYVKDGRIEEGKYYASDIGRGINPVRESDVLKRMACMLDEELKGR